MGILDRLRGTGAQRPLSQNAEPSADEQAIARYRYLVRTAPPETIEQAHAEAFAQLTPDQRRRVLQELSTSMSVGERMAAARAADDPEVLARMATRAEIRQPGTLERIFGSQGGASAAAPGLGSMMAGGFLASMAGTVLGSMIAQQFLANAAPSHLFGDALPSHDPSTSPDGTARLIDDPFKHASTDRGEDFASGDDADVSDGDDLGSGDDAASGDFGGDFGGGDSFDV
jgi:hypothetical protein